MIRRCIVALAFLGPGLVAAPATAQEREPPVPSSPESDVAVRTGKERLGDKASDEQRVNDCKVPEDRRGSSTRSDECGAPSKATSRE